MSTVNDTENPDTPENLDTAENPDTAESPDSPDSPDGAERPDGADGASAEAPEDTGTTVYVRRGRTPTLGLWVVLALAVPAVAALLVAPLFDFTDLGGVVSFALVAAVVVGLPLAALAALVDALRHRDRGPRR